MTQVVINIRYYLESHAIGGLNTIHMQTAIFCNSDVNKFRHNLTIKKMAAWQDISREHISQLYLMQFSPLKIFQIKVFLLI